MNETVKEQYCTSDKLSIRITLHSKYSVNKQGFGNWIYSHYRIREGMSVLELGCGTGEMWCGKDDIVRRCSRLILSDFSEGMLETAKENLRDFPEIEYRCIDIQNIPFPDKTFDVVIANMMLYHVPDLAKGLMEVQRVLKDSGTFYCATYGENGMMEHVDLMFDEFPVSGARNYSFTLQNGKKILEDHFSKVQMLQYEDALEVTDVEDMIDYIYSLPSWSDIQDLPRDTIRSTLERNMHDGILRLPKDYGMFIAEGPGEKLFPANGGVYEKTVDVDGCTMKRFGLKQKEEGKMATVLYQGHGSLRVVTAEGKVIYIDPFFGEGYDLPADLILMSHGHYDHTQDNLITTKNADCIKITWAEALKDGVHQSFDLGFVKVEAVEAGYNKNHNAKECVGFVLTFSDGVTLYVSGDTSTTPTMPALAKRNLDYAFFCCDGIFNMDIAEASECAKAVGAKHSIPYHMAPSSESGFDRKIAESFTAEGRIILEPKEELELQ